MGKRADKYEQKLSFDSTFEDMVTLSLKGAGEVVKKREIAKKSKNLKAPFRVRSYLFLISPNLYIVTLSSASPLLTPSFTFLGAPYRFFSWVSGHDQECLTRL